MLPQLENRNIIVFDLETNGLNARNSVLSCSAIKYQYVPSEPELIEIDRFTRFYFSKEPENPAAIKKNRLTRQVLEEKRLNQKWPKYFSDDPGFRDFCVDADLLVAHNVDFDSKFVPFLSGKTFFCTMKGSIKDYEKYPKLEELAERYNVEYDRKMLHGSLYDTQITAGIFNKMIQTLKVQEYSD